MIVSVNKESKGKRVNEFRARIHLQTKDQGEHKSFSAPQDARKLSAHQRAGVSIQIRECK